MRHRGPDWSGYQLISQGTTGAAKAMLGVGSSASSESLQRLCISERGERGAARHAIAHERLAIIDPESGASLPRRAARGGRARARGRPPGAPRGRESGPRADRTWYAAFASLHFAAASFRMSGNGHTGSSSDCAWAREWARGGEGVSATRNAGGDELGPLAIALEILVHLVRGACTPGVSPIIPITRFTF